MRLNHICKVAITAMAFVFAVHAIPSRAAGTTKSQGRVHSTVERMNREHLKAAHEAVEVFKAKRKPVKPLPNLKDFKTILHAHAEDAAHTGGTRPEMLADAKRAGVEIIMLTDHYRPPKDFITGSWRGLRDGVLFIPGSEIRGFLIYPAGSIMEKMEQPIPEFIKTVTEGDGLIFLSHIEERVNHSMDGLTGMEIYNRHADAKDDMASMLAIATMMTDPKQAAILEESLKLYPDEMLATQLDYPAQYLEKWDKETQKQRVTGVAANDCHHNQIYIVKMVDENKVLLGTNVDKDEEMRAFTSEQRPGIKEMTKGKKPGDILVSLDFDPYYRSFFNASTHVLAKEQTEWAIRAALTAGHAYVSHDWMCDPEGFEFVAVKETEKDGKKEISVAAIMGDEIKAAPGVSLFSLLPLECKVKLIRDGKVIEEKTQNFLKHPIDGPGVYRIEAWLTVDGEDRPWIYSNPIYVRP